MEMITSTQWDGMFLSAFKSLKQNLNSINELNVFPVPDGDTGTNMAATFSGGIEAMSRCQQNSVGEKAKTFANGALYSARGNSGVILSQFFAGLAEGLDRKESVGLSDLIFALECGVKKAYTAVNKPVEGTILTVARVAEEQTKNQLSSVHSYEDFFGSLQAEAKKALDKTPDLLDVLKEANVVDSGGAGLYVIFKGFYGFFAGIEIADTPFDGPKNNISENNANAFNEKSVMDYGYCTEFILQLLESKCDVVQFNLKEFIAFLETIGDSIVAVQDGTRVKVHVHTKTPWIAIEKALSYGEFISFKMENMSMQHNEVLLKSIKEKAKHAVVAVAPSEEIAKILCENGANEIILGGQTMNPSSEDFLMAFERANAEFIVVFPNNSNILLTAKQAQSMYKDPESIYVAPCKSFAVCLSTLEMLDWTDSNTIPGQIENHLSEVCEISFTKAIRSTINHGKEVKEGDFIAITGHEITASSPDFSNCIQDAFNNNTNVSCCGVINAFYGNECSEAEKEALRTIVQGLDMVDLVEFEGMQPVYDLVISLE